MMNDSTHIDPVCGMSVDPAHAAGSSLFGGTTHYFCATACKTAFDSNPEQYVEEEAEPAACCGPAASCCRG